MLAHTPIADLSILSRNHLLAEAERMARQLRGIAHAKSVVLHERHCGAPDSVVLSMLLSALEDMESPE